MKQIAPGVGSDLNQAVEGQELGARFTEQLVFLQRPPDDLAELACGQGCGDAAQSDVAAILELLDLMPDVDHAAFDRVSAPIDRAARYDFDAEMASPDDLE